MKLLEKVKKMKILKGYVENRTKEAALATIMAALVVVFRQFQIPLVPGVVISFMGLFLYLPSVILSWPYTWLIPVVASVTAPRPLFSFIAVSIGCQAAYFSSRLLPKRSFYKVLPFVLGAYIANIVGVIIYHYAEILHFTLGFPLLMVKGTVSALVAVVLAPPVFKVLEVLGVVTYE